MTTGASTTPVAVPAPPLQPHPAKGAKEAAMKMYPALAVKDSTFNKVFRDLYMEESQKNPETLTKADWPLVLAHRTASILTPPPMTPGPKAMTASSANSARAEGSFSAAKPSPTPNALERGAYNQARSPYWWGPWTRYY